MQKQLPPEYHLNRELSWLEFNARVLDEAADPDNPLLERLKFIAIFSNNLDEFFMVRVAALKQQLASEKEIVDAAGLTTVQQLQRIMGKVKELVALQYQCLLKGILPPLSAHGTVLLKAAELRENERQELKRYFEQEILPVLTPVAVDPSHPFPVLTNCALEILVRLKRPGSKTTVTAFVEVPKLLPRFIEVRGNLEGGAAYIPLEELILEYLDLLFVKCNIEHAFPFRITRDMDFSIDEESAADLLLHMEKQLLRQHRREVVRLETVDSAAQELVLWLAGQANLPHEAVFTLPGLLGLEDMFRLIAKESRPGLIEPPWPPLETTALAAEQPIMDTLRDSGDILLCHPFEAFDPVPRLLREAAEDPQVLAIKQTLYRVSGDSPVVRALQRAAENGKQVTVIVEIKARFDEEQNIAWARSLDESGVHVIYGVVGLKIHCKALMIIRREEGRICRYVHLATGNYNDSTARVYTDIGMFTTNPGICTDVAALFNVITGYSEPPRWQCIAVAPFDMREKFLYLIDREARTSTKQAPGRIIAKMNSLVDPEVIAHLYKAAEAGVQIDLIVRGICCLRPGIGTRNIRIISIVDRFLEHSRVFYFANAGNPEYFLSSADWMPRNLNRRIEILFPVEEKNARERLWDLLQLQLKDTRKGRVLKKSGCYTPVQLQQQGVRSQEQTYLILAAANKPEINIGKAKTRILPVLKSGNKNDAS